MTSQLAYGSESKVIRTNTYFQPEKGPMLKHTYILYSQAGFSSEYLDYLDGCWHRDSVAPVAGGNWRKVRLLEIDLG